MKKPIIAIAHQTITDGDAIGNDIMGMYNTLIDEGYNVGLLSEYSADSLKKYQMNSASTNNFFETPDSILIYHHSIYWEFGERILEKCKGKIIFKFHNITPTRFFKDFSSLHYEKCLQGIEQTKRLINAYKNCPWWGDSSFNSFLLQQIGLKSDHITTVPPFHRLDALEKIEPSYKIIDDLIRNNNNNVLFVGRVAPNKGHIHLINIIKTYKENYDSNIHLWVLGPIDHDQLQLYFNQLSVLIKKYGLEKNISFIDKKPETDIKAYYLGCDEFLCMSEHEGFCVPVIEAQQFMLPVVTYGGAALRETAGINQIIMDSFDYPFAASALFTIFTDEKVRNFCKKHGRINVDSRFSSEKIKNKFLSEFARTVDGNQQ
jgi:glycosyltransferase involved in cell wall biosynthesis